MPSCRPLKIKNYTINSNIILAPLSGVTDYPFRKIVREISSDSLVVSEMVASHGFLYNGVKTLLKANITDEAPQGSFIQLAGRDPDIIAEVAKINADNGAKIIDLNFGCPAKKVTNGFAGSALMKDEKLASQILNKVVSSVNIPVTLKMRMGWCNESLNALTIAKIAEDAGIAMITVHGRTRNQFFNGQANWKFVKTIKENVSIPVIVNGDIVDFDSLTQALNESNADGAMIGRATYGNPWLLKRFDHFLKTNEKLPDVTLETKFATIKKHFQYILNFYGEEAGIKLSRKHINWYLAGLPNASKTRLAINKSTNTESTINILDDFLISLKEEVCY